jgi:hypothetical protein
MPFGLSSKKASPLAAKPEAMSSEVTLVDSSHTRSDKQATAGNTLDLGSFNTQPAAWLIGFLIGPGSKKTKMTWKEARALCKKEESWEARVRESEIRLYLYGGVNTNFRIGAAGY